MGSEKWLLVNPPTGRYIREDRCQAPVRGLIATALRPPLDLAYIAAAASATGAECRIADYPAERRTWADFERDVRWFAPTYLVVSTTTFTVGADMEACLLAKAVRGGTVVLAKGAVFAADPEQLLERHPALDGAVIGDYEMGFHEIASGRPWTGIAGLVFRSDGRIVKNPARPPVPLDELFAPRRDLIRHELYRRPDTGRLQTSVLVGRGCAGRCIYCVAPVVGGRRVRYRSAAGVAAEVAQCRERDGVEDFYFVADTFTWDREWVLDFCRRVEGQGLRVNWLCNARADRLDDECLWGMKRAGCWGVSLGVESGSQAILDRIGKGITLDQVRAAVALVKRRGLVSLLHFMIGFPWEDRETIAATVRFARELKGSLTEFNMVTPLPGTPLWDLAHEQGLMAPGADLAGADYSLPMVRTFSLGPEKLAALRRRAFWRLYFDPGFWWRSLGHMTSWNRFWRCLAILASKLLWIMRPRWRATIGGFE